VPGALTLHTAAFADLDPHTLYALLRLRVNVFVVEQACAFPELDGRDAEPGARHLWLSAGGRPHGGRPVAYLRILPEPGGAARISRVAVAPEHRGHGHAARLLDAALAAIGDRECMLDAQAHLTRLYARHGFVPTGPEFLEDGIPHVPMRRPAAPDLPAGQLRQP
jgi:ElaA protein